MRQEAVRLDCRCVKIISWQEKEGGKVELAQSNK